jgi:hypothetical protein
LTIIIYVRNIFGLATKASSHPSLMATGRATTSAVPAILLQKSSGGDERNFWTADAFRAKRCEGPRRSPEKPPRSFVSAPQNIAAAESSKIRLSRDFRCRPIFDFCNIIPPTADIVGQCGHVRKPAQEPTSRINVARQLVPQHSSHYIVTIKMDIVASRLFIQLGARKVVMRRSMKFVMALVRYRCTSGTSGEITC